MTTSNEDPPRDASSASGVTKTPPRDANSTNSLTRTRPREMRSANGLTRTPRTDARSERTGTRIPVKDARSAASRMKIRRGRASSRTPVGAQRERGISANRLESHIVARDEFGQTLRASRNVANGKHLSGAL